MSPLLLPRRPQFVIYDLDGVLLDTEPLYTEVTQEIVAGYGKTFDWSVKSRMIGRPSTEAAAVLVEALELPISAQQYLDMRRAGLEQRFRNAPAKAGAERFTRELSERGVRQAVATSSERAMYEAKLEHHREWFELFATVVTGDDPRVARGKPAPDIFLIAATEIGAPPAQCLVFEDSPAGVEAARAAGMQVVAVPAPEMDRAQFSAAELVIDGFDSLTAAELGF